MNLLLYDIDEKYIAKLGSLAKKKGVSRNEFLKNALENLASRVVIKTARSELCDLIEICTDVLKENTVAVNKLIEILESED